MKVLALLVAAGALGGCVAYPYPAGPYGRGGYYEGGASVSVQPAPVYIEGGSRHHGSRHHGGRRWDRDGDGVPNRHDARPHNPYRY